MLLGSAGSCVPALAEPSAPEVRIPVSVKSPKTEAQPPQTARTLPEEKRRDTWELSRTLPVL